MYLVQEHFGNVYVGMYVCNVYVGMYVHKLFCNSLEFQSYGLDIGKVYGFDILLY